MGLFRRNKHDRPTEDIDAASQLPAAPVAPPRPSAIEYLLSHEVANLTVEERAAMTTSCRDADRIPKVADAGQVIEVDGRSVQVMHNGVRVVTGCYYGDWMTDIIRTLRGHHEPQEELAFHQVMQRVGPGATMLELGCFWAYYTLWFRRMIPDGRNVCCEPDPDNLAMGTANAALNGLEGITFVQAAAGSAHDTPITLPSDPRPHESVETVVKSVDGLVAEHDLDRLDILHMDVQGVELDTLRGVEATVAAGNVRFLFVSTHHYQYSGAASTHADCLAWIRDHGGHIITSHTVAESFSGDGLIVASFDERDRDFVIDMTLNHTDRSLFRSPEADLQLLLDRDAAEHPA